MRTLTLLVLAALTANCSLIVRNKLEDDDPRDGGVDLPGRPDGGAEGGLPPGLEAGVAGVFIEREQYHRESFLIGEYFFVELVNAELFQVWLRSDQDPARAERAIDQPCPCEPFWERPSGPMPGEEVPPPQEGEPTDPSWPDEPIMGSQRYRCSIPPRTMEGPARLQVEYGLPEPQGISVGMHDQPIEIQRLLVIGSGGGQELTLHQAINLQSAEQGLSFPAGSSLRAAILSPSGRYVLLAVKGECPDHAPFHYLVWDLVQDTTTRTTLCVSELTLNERAAAFESRFHFDEGRPSERIFLPELAAWVLNDRQQPVRLELPPELPPEQAGALPLTDVFLPIQQLLCLNGQQESRLIGYSAENRSLAAISADHVVGIPLQEPEKLVTVDALTPVQWPGTLAESLLILTTQQQQSGSGDMASQKVVLLYKMDTDYPPPGAPLLRSVTSRVLASLAVRDLEALPGTPFFGLRYEQNISGQQLQFGRTFSQSPFIDFSPLPQLGIDQIQLLDLPPITLPTAYGSSLLGAVARASLFNAEGALFTIFDANAPANVAGPAFFPGAQQYVHHPVEQRFYTIEQPLLLDKPGRLDSYPYTLGEREIRSTIKMFLTAPLKEPILLIQP